MAFKNFPSPHVHSTASLDTASTPEAFAKWEAEHETGALTVTDHGTLAGARRVYDLAYGKKYKGKLTPILGLEAYFRDDSCPILTAGGIEQTPRYRNEETGQLMDEETYEKRSEKERQGFVKEMTFSEYQKYFHLTMHFRDQPAYETACRLLSFADDRAEKHGSEYKPIFGWQQLEELGAQNVVFTSSCLIGMVQRHLVFGERRDLAEAYYKRVRELVRPGNFYVEAFPHVCDRNWTETVIMKFTDGTEERFYPKKKVRTDRHSVGKDKSKGCYAKDLAYQFKQHPLKGERLLAVMTNRKMTDREPKEIASVEYMETFIVNECKPWCPDGDLQKPANQFVLEMARKYGDKILISDDSHFVNADEKIIQDIKLSQQGSWRFHTSYHRMTGDEAWHYFDSVLGVPQSEFERWIDNGHEWVSGFKDFKFQNRKSLPTRFYPEKTLEHTMALIQRHGRMLDSRDPQYGKYFARLRAEINLLHYNKTIDLLPYFFIDEEVCELYERHGLLTGPGRGSAAGMELAFLLGITHVDPIRYGLSMDRFLTPDRVQSGKLPDIDQDLPHRMLLEGVNPEFPETGWLRQRFGDCVVQIGTDVSLKLRNTVLDVARALSPIKRVPEEVARLAHHFEDAPQGISDRDHVFGYDNNGEWATGSIETDEALKTYIARYPQDWAIVQKCLGVPKTKGRHPCGFVISDDPIYTFIPLTTVNGVKVTQPAAPQVEASGGLKMDFLVVNSLKDIGECIRLIQERSPDQSLPWAKVQRRNQLDPDWRNLPPAPSTRIGGRRVPLQRVVPHQGRHLDIWDLPEDQAVFRSICEGDTDSVFQFGTPGAVKWLKHFDHMRFKDAQGEIHKALDSIEALAAFTALDRPGPLDAYVENPETGNNHNMLIEFARRARGEKAIGSFPILDKLFPETYGVLVYQEQLQKAFQEIGGTTGIEANNFRIHVSKKQMKEVIADKAIFMKGAVGRIGEDAANQLWQSMETFGQYGFNKSHAVCYVIIGYACAWLKHHYPLEWWTAVLCHAKKKEVEEKFWKHVGPLMINPDVSKSGDNYIIDGKHIRAPLNLLNGIGDKAHEEFCGYRPLKNIRDLCEKIYARKQATGSWSEKVNKDTGKSKRTFTKGRSSINRGIIQKLIVTGAMDSLFPADTVFTDKLSMYFQAKCEVEGLIYKKTGVPKEKPDPIYFKLNALTLYQLRKQILPSYSEDLLSSISDASFLPGVSFNSGRYWFLPPDCDPPPVALTDARGLLVYNTIPIRKGNAVYLAALAYVMNNEQQGYHGTKVMSKFLVDIEGQRFEFVKWPDRDGSLPLKFKNTDFTGSLVILLLSKWNSEKPFSIDDVFEVAEPLKLKQEDSPDTEGE